MFDSTDLLERWMGQRVIFYLLAPGGPPTSLAPEGESGRIAYPLGVGTAGGVLIGFDDRGVIVDSGSVHMRTEELRFFPWSAILEFKSGEVQRIP